jgi:hypothetical protein
MPYKKTDLILHNADETPDGSGTRDINIRFTFHEAAHN